MPLLSPSDHSMLDQLWAVTSFILNRTNLELDKQRPQLCCQPDENVIIRCHNTEIARTQSTASSCGPDVRQYSKAPLPWTWRSLLTSSMAPLDPWGSFEKHSQDSEAKGSTSLRGNIAHRQGVFQWWLLACCAAIQYGTASMDTDVTADLFHG